MGIRSKVSIAIVVALIGLFVATSVQVSKYFSAEVTELKLSQVGELASGVRHIVGQWSDGKALQQAEFANQYWQQFLIDSNFPKSERALNALKASSYLGLVVLAHDPAGSWKPSLIINRESHYWFANAVTADLLTKLPLAKVQAGKAIWSRIEGPKRRAYLLSMTLKKLSTGEKTLSLGLLPMQYMSDLGSALKRGESELIIVDDKSYALVYPEQRYVGSRLNDQTFTSLISGANGAGVYVNAAGDDFVGAAERVNTSNLKVFVRSPASSKFSSTTKIKSVLGLNILIVGILLIAVLLVLITPWARGLDYLIEAVNTIGSQKPIRLPDNQIGKIMALRESLKKIQGDYVGVGSGEDLKVGFSAEDKVVLMRQVSTGVLETLMAPVTAILGHVQMARSKAQGNEDLKQHLIVIERETRQIRSNVDNLSSSVPSTEGDLVRTELREVVLQALSSVRGAIQNRAVNVVKKLEASGKVLVNHKQMLFVIEQVLQNALDSMETTSDPKLEISLIEKNGFARLIIKDSGKGMNQQMINKMFTPFVSGKPKTGQAGLGLTIAMGIVKGFKGEFEVDSKEGQGTSLSLSIPLASEARKQMANVATAPVATEAVVQQPTPKTSELKSVQAVAPVEDLSVKDLAGEKPLSGTKREELPAAPGFDEMTLVGDELLSKMDNALGDELKANEENSKDENGVVIRTPKVRVKD